MQFDSNQIQRIIEFFEQENQGWHYHSRSLIQYYEEGRIKKPCSCGFNYFFIRSDGSLYLCPLVDKQIGNVPEVPVQDLYYSRTASKVRQRVGREPQCKSSTEPGLERYSLPFEGVTYLGSRLRMGKTAFLQMHEHLGLEKYIRK
jgi:MoaA/NifB/PqqE/SkfB family radical SAM enzyme